VSDVRLIYFIRPIGMEGPIKIGCSYIPRSRVTQLEYWSPFPLELMAEAPGSPKLEFCVHRIFAADRLHLEWFKPSPALLTGIDRVKAGESIEQAFSIERRERRRWGSMEPYFVPSGAPA
jgi:hypothetical protein